MKKYLKRIVLILVIVLIICIIGIVIYKMRPLPNAQGKIDSMNRLTKYKDSSEIIILNNTQEWSEKYTGRVSIAAINTIINYFAKELIPEYRNVENVEEYYESNKDVIRTFTGVDNLEDFKGIVEKAKKLEGNDLKLERAEYVKNTSRVIGKSVYSILALQYKGNDKILFNVVISGYIEDGISAVSFDSNVDEENYDTSRKEIIVYNEDPSQHTGRVTK